MLTSGPINLPELDALDLQKAKEDFPVMAAFLYTPTCGTCQLAKQMMGVLAESLPEVKVFQINLNHHEELAAKYRVMSVPCLLIFQAGRHQESIYGFGVAGLYEKLLTYMEKEAKI